MSLDDSKPLVILLGVDMTLRTELSLSDKGGEYRRQLSSGLVNSVRELELSQANEETLPDSVPEPKNLLSRESLDPGDMVPIEADKKTSSSISSKSSASATVLKRKASSRLFSLSS